MPLSRARAVALSLSTLIEVGRLTGKEAEKVVALRRDGEVWVLEVDVVDLRRIPDTTDVLATYRVEVGDDGEILDLRRIGRHVRTWIGDQH